MRPFAQAAGLELEWRGSGFIRREYALVAGNDVFATLDWRGAFGSLATAETATGSWTFKRSGFLRPSATARIAGTDTQIAVLSLSFGGTGTLDVAGGGRYEWVNPGFWNAKWGFTDATGPILVQFQPRLAVLTTVTGVAINDCLQPDVPLLVTLGWYMLVLMAQESAAAAAIIMS